MKNLVCIFAHPDDEAFGPGGTIALMAQKQPVYLICVTNGDAGMNSTNETRELAEIRREELIRSANILGVKHVYFLEYKDGSLCNNIYHEIAEKLQHILDELQPETLLTFEYRGISGHIDHIAVSMITSFLYERLEYVKKVLYYCLNEEQRRREDPYFIYLPPGYHTHEIDEIIDVSSVWEQKVACMHEHKSQKHDADRVLARLEKLPHEECFIVKEK